VKLQRQFAFIDLLSIVFPPGSLLVIRYAKYCSLRDVLGSVITKLVKDPGLEINAEPSESTSQGKELPIRIVCEVNLARFEVAADTVVAVSFRLGKNRLVESAYPLFRVAIGIAVRAEVNAITTVE
jgi:hypothetical protein